MRRRHPREWPATHLSRPTTDLKTHSRTALEYFFIAQDCGWWWKRIPRAGSLAEALVAEKRR